jgi:hypothetical protein
MAVLASVVLRHQFEVAKRQDEVRGTRTSLDEVREKVVVALGIVGQRLQPIDAAAVRHDVAWLAATYPDWVSERSLLRDEVLELKRLLDHVDLFLNASAT